MFNMVKFDKKGGVIGAVTGAVSGALASSTNLNLLETMGVACIVGIIIAAIIYLVWK